MSNFDRLNAREVSVRCEARDDGLYVVRDGDWEINVTQLKIQHDEARTESERLRTALEAIAEYGEKAMASHATIVDTMLRTARAALGRVR